GHPPPPPFRSPPACRDEAENCPPSRPPGARPGPLRPGHLVFSHLPPPAGHGKRREPAADYSNRASPNRELVGPATPTGRRPGLPPGRLRRSPSRFPEFLPPRRTSTHASDHLPS